MKRTALVLSAAGLLGLAACGGGEEVAEGSPAPTAAPTSSSFVPPTDEEKQETALAACQEDVRDRLKSPGSAVFPAFEDVQFELSTPTTVEVESYVDSQNSFGALLRSEWQCTARVYGDGSLRDVFVTIVPN